MIGALPAEHQADLDHLLNIAPAIAYKRLGTVNDDAVQDLREAMLRAAAAYQPDRGMTFKSWVTWKGACVTVDRFRAYTHVRDPHQVISLDYYATLNDDGELRDDMYATLGHHDDGFDLVEAAIDLRKFVGSQRKRDREICRRYFVDGERQRAIGASLGLTEARICQVLTKFLRRVAAHMQPVA